MNCGLVRRVTFSAAPLLGLLLAASLAGAQAKPLPGPAKKAAIAAMKRALRQALVTQSEGYETTQSFARTPALVTGAQSAGFSLAVVEADGRGWAAVTTSTADSSLRCGIFVGMAAAPNAAVLAPTVPACWSVAADGSMTGEN